MKLMKTLSVAILLAVSATSFAGQANKFNVQFERGSDHASLVGTVRGHDYDSYVFRANKGQILSIQAHNSDPQIQTALFYKGSSDGLNSTSIRLPHSGEYELRVMKSRADSKNNTVRQYDLVFAIRSDSETPKPAKKPAAQRGQTISYLCDSKGAMKVNYVDINGKYPKATVYYKGHSYALSYEPQYSDRNDLMVFGDGKFSMNLDRSQTKDLHLAEVIAFNQRVKGNDRVVLQNCQPQR